MAQVGGPQLTLPPLSPAVTESNCIALAQSIQLDIWHVARLAPCAWVAAAQAVTS
ncbi:MAG: hypothetical protein HYR94_16565 [Chloroflexi bacterium]|nr:hypothetical protein [Chloroflexota bacterium]